MAKNTNIQWADSTFNPVIGCKEVGPGCDNCYARNQDNFRHWTSKGWGGPRKRTSEANWKQPIKWNVAKFYECPDCGERGDEKDMHETRDTCKHDRKFETRRRVFCASLSDVFDNEWDEDWRGDLFRLILETPNLDWLLLTKRIGNVSSMLNELTKTVGGLLTAKDEYMPPPNVWIGATVVNQEEVDRDIPKLLAVPVAATARRFVSLEPLLASVNIVPYIGGRAIRCGCGWRETEYGLVGALITREVCIACGKRTVSGPTLDWVIAGGESGSGARPSHPSWYRSLRDQCSAAKTPFHFKQWGEWAPHKAVAGGDEGGDLRSGRVRYLQGDGREPDGHFRKGDAAVKRIGKKAAGRLLDGVEHNEFPNSRDDTSANHNYVKPSTASLVEQPVQSVEDVQSGESLQAPLPAAPATRPPVVDVGGARTWALIETLLAATHEKNTLHTKYFGKAMPDEVYERFAFLRDTRIPEIRNEITVALTSSKQQEGKK